MNTLSTLKGRDLPLEHLHATDFEAAEKSDEKSFKTIYNGIKYIVRGSVSAVLSPFHTISDNEKSDEIKKTEAAENIKKSIVWLRTPFGQGTGVLVAPDMIATAYHVVEGFEDDWVYCNIPGLHRDVGTIEWADPTQDLAYIRIPPLPEPVLNQVNIPEFSGDPAENTRMIAAGYPHLFQDKERYAPVKYDVDETTGVVEASGFIRSGFSGGPIAQYNEETGQTTIHGISQATWNDAPRLTFDQENPTDVIKYIPGDRVLEIYQNEVKDQVRNIMEMPVVYCDDECLAAAA